MSQPIQKASPALGKILFTVAVIAVGLVIASLAQSSAPLSEMPLWMRPAG
ncbi:hypothetical protein [Gymnodinialimonas ceratoperidinii]|uniref:Uncharacterized protein n=1 Tax=Gymnodinialimonas ceratoperidinii TaxID=2856823 RepID=A0A8F6TTQ8_9RHOB|nr:hypothetical protein [Gymnodinialimonas ceratoperidinii]QXT38540.1 hypothetical protein KYE46_11395 [Gymnodinialimonas ceratoperidinii]